MKVGIIGCGNISDTYFQSQNLYNNINIINIHRSKYGINDKKEPVVRGDVEDLLLSSTFYKAPTQNYLNRPLIILYKYTNSSNTIYNIIVDSSILPVGEKSIYMRIKDIPQAIKYLIFLEP